MEFWKSMMKLKINWHPAWWESKASWRAASWVVTERIHLNTGRPPWGPSILLLFSSFFYFFFHRPFMLHPSYPTHRKSTRHERVSRDAERKFNATNEEKRKRPNKEELPAHSAPNVISCPLEDYSTRPDVASSQRGREERPWPDTSSPLAQRQSRGHSPLMYSEWSSVASGIFLEPRDFSCGRGSDQLTGWQPSTPMLTWEVNNPCCLGKTYKTNTWWIWLIISS